MNGQTVPNVGTLPQSQRVPSREQATQPAAPPPAPVAAAPEPKPQPILEMHEAPYSWNCATISIEGFNEMFTIRSVSPEAFYERVKRLKANLLDMGYKPAPTRGAAVVSGPAGQDNAQPQSQVPNCAIHGTPMSQRQGRNGMFWSCPQKLTDGTWCPYRPANK